MEEADRKKLERGRKRSQGFLPKQIWVHKSHIKEFERMREKWKERKK